MPSPAPPLANPETEPGWWPHILIMHEHSWVTCSKVKITHFLNSLPFLKFATNEAIQRTEAYEYAQSLGTQSSPMPNFQVSCICGAGLTSLCWLLVLEFLAKSDEVFAAILGRHLIYIV